MAGLTMGEERNWQQLLQLLAKIAKATERIADALEDKPKEQA